VPALVWGIAQALIPSPGTASAKDGFDHRCRGALTGLEKADIAFACARLDEPGQVSVVSARPAPPNSCMDEMLLLPCWQRLSAGRQAS
jgi:hypothetical protein